MLTLYSNLLEFTYSKDLRLNAQTKLGQSQQIFFDLLVAVSIGGRPVTRQTFVSS